MLSKLQDFSVAFPANPGIFLPPGTLIENSIFFPNIAVYSLRPIILAHNKVIFKF